jgi:hypothetical protein
MELDLVVLIQRPITIRVEGSLLLKPSVIAWQLSEMRLEQTDQFSVVTFFSLAKEK